MDEWDSEDDDAEEQIRLLSPGQNGATQLPDEDLGKGESPLGPTKTIWNPSMKKI